jgi:UDP-glucose 4-epimerase
VRALVTGGAGFLGSHLVARLLADGHAVVAYDNLSSGRLAFLEGSLAHPRFRFVRGDLLDAPGLAGAMDGCDTVFHLAANPDVRAGLRDPSLDLRQETLATYNVLEAMRRRGVGRVVLASSSTVYGAAPGPGMREDGGPLLPISPYGAGKLAAEAWVSALSHLHGWRAWILRLANVVGPRLTHGVIYDLCAQLDGDPRQLVVLGDGRQSKPYLHVSECVDGMLFAVEHAVERVSLLNLSCDSTVDVATIARLVLRARGLDPDAVPLRYTGGSAGWPGDVPQVRLSTERLGALGWRARWSAREAVERAVREFVAQRSAGVV